jgi:hypothetical protein
MDTTKMKYLQTIGIHRMFLNVAKFNVTNRSISSTKKKRRFNFPDKFFLSEFRGAQFTHERVDYNVFLFDEPFKGSKSMKILKLA